jgi:hypothetical protein
MVRPCWTCTARSEAHSHPLLGCLHVLQDALHDERDRNRGVLIEVIDRLLFDPNAHRL